MDSGNQVSHRMLLLAIFVGVIFLLGVYIKPNFFADFAIGESNYTGNIIYPLVLYSHNPTALFITLALSVVLILLWAKQNLVRYWGCVVLSLFGAVMFTCCASVGADKHLGSFDLLFAENIMNEFVQQDTVQINENVYHLVLAKGLVSYAGGFSDNYGFIVFKCDSLSLVCGVAAAKHWEQNMSTVGNRKHLDCILYPVEYKWCMVIKLSLTHLSLTKAILYPAKYLMERARWLYRPEINLRAEMEITC